MAITNLDGLIAAPKQLIPLIKTATRTTVAAIPFSVFDLAGNPGAGTLAGGNTANGVVPDDTVAGFPPINSFSGGALGYISNIDCSYSVAGLLWLYDMLFKAGAYSYAAGTTTLNTQPSYSGRVPGGSDYHGTQIWCEVSTAFVTGNNWQVSCTYTNQAGTTGRQTPTITAMAAAALTLGKMFQLPLQAGDSGVQKIESVIVTNGTTAMTAGAFNVLVLRPLWGPKRIGIANGGDTDGPDRTGLIQVFDTSALYPVVQADSTSSGLPSINIEISNG